jgi:hypothetical protein
MADEAPADELAAAPPPGCIQILFVEPNSHPTPAQINYAQVVVYMHNLPTLHYNVTKNTTGYPITVTP